MYKKCIFLVIFFMIGSLQALGANPLHRNLAHVRHRRQSGGFTWENMQVRMSYGLKVMGYGLLLPKMEYIFGKETAIQTSWPQSLTLTLGYAWLLSPERKLGFEVGVGYDFNNTVTMSRWSSTISETTLKVPLLVSITNLYPDLSFDFALSQIIGYEFHYILKSESTDINQGTTNPFRQLFEINGVDFPNFSGSIISATRFEFPKGIYADLKLTLPIESFKCLSYNGDFSGGDLNDGEKCIRSTHYVRLYRADYLQFAIGVDLMKWIYTQEKNELHARRNRRR